MGFSSLEEVVCSKWVGAFKVTLVTCERLSGLGSQVLCWALFHPRKDVFPLGGSDVLLVSVVLNHSDTSDY